ncbi:hypothetical protein GWI33_020023 [Rhynchophorus ferrugineus]|uniref:Uncharacterized protein n=1 Tax=Rhynchophorus ferrugineus TaxID=354439 RepID=A0A834HV49_RHYFE|nr:hypothetical protein GWI33_020023 [Rhynchophorus ferrugineus]
MSSVNDSLKSSKFSNEETTVGKNSEHESDYMKHKSSLRKTLPLKRKRVNNSANFDQTPVLEFFYCIRRLPSQSTAKKLYKYQGKSTQERRKLYSILNDLHKLGSRSLKATRPTTSFEAVMDPQLSPSEPPPKRVCRRNYVVKSKTPRARRRLFPSEPNDQDDQDPLPLELEDSPVKETNNETGYDSGLEYDEYHEAAKTLEGHRKSKQINDQLKPLLDMLKNIKIELNKQILIRTVKTETK